MGDIELEDIALAPSELGAILPWDEDPRPSSAVLEWFVSIAMSPVERIVAVPNNISFRSSRSTFLSGARSGIRGWIPL